MGEAFFTEVTGPIPFGGLDSRRPAGVQGLPAGPAGARQADGGPPPPGRLLLALVRLAGHGHVRHRHARPAVARPGRATRWTRRARRWPSRSSSSRSSACPTTASTIATSRPRGRLRRVPRQPRRARRRRRRATRSGPASGSCGARPTCSPIRATRRAPPPTPIPRCSPTPRRRSSTCSRSPSASAAQNYVLWGGREGYDTLLNTDLRREGAQLARFLHLVVEHKHKIGFEGQLLIEPKPMEPTKHQYDYDVATVHGFLVQQRARGRVPAPTSRPTTRRWPATASTTRSRSRRPTGCSAASTPTAATRRTAGTPTSSRTRSRTWRCRCTRSCAPAASRPAASTSTPSCAARARDRNDLFHAHIGGLDTLARALLVAADLVERGELAALRGRGATRAGTASSARRSWAAR